jgi:hypothetical protein
VKDTGQVTGSIKRPEIKRLGNPFGARALLRNPEWRKTGQPRAVQALKEQANKRASSLAATFADLETKGFITANAKAAELNNRGTPTPRGGKWEARTIIDAIKRIKQLDTKV